MVYWVVDKNRVLPSVCGFSFFSYSQGLVLWDSAECAGDRRTAPFSPGVVPPAHSGVGPQFQAIRVSACSLCVFWTTAEQNEDKAFPVALPLPISAKDQ